MPARLPPASRPDSGLPVLLTYYTTVFCVYGKLALGHGPKAGIATGIIVVYNVLARLGSGQPRPSSMHHSRTSRLVGAGVYAAVVLLCGRAHGAGQGATRLAAQRGRGRGALGRGLQGGWLLETLHS